MVYSCTKICGNTIVPVWIKRETVLYLPAEIQEMTEFRHDVAFCLTRNGIGVVDKAGKMIVPADYDDGEFINSERLALKSKGKWALFDFKGNRVTPFIYDKIYPWSHANRVLFIKTAWTS